MTTDTLLSHRSVSGKQWRMRAVDERAALALSQREGLPDIVARILTGRGIGLEDSAKFLEPTLRDWMPDPGHLKDMDQAVARIIAAVETGETIAIFGDYDVDGATSSAPFAWPKGTAPMLRRWRGWRARGRHWPSPWIAAHSPLTRWRRRPTRAWR